MHAVSINPTISRRRVFPLGPTAQGEGIRSPMYSIMCCTTGGHPFRALPPTSLLINKSPPRECSLLHYPRAFLCGLISSSGRWMALFWATLCRINFHHRVCNFRMGAWMPCVYLPRWAVTRPGKQASTRSTTIGTIPNVAARSRSREDSLLVRTGRSRPQREVLLPIVRPDVLCCVPVFSRQKADRTAASAPYAPHTTP